MYNTYTLPNGVRLHIEDLIDAVVVEEVFPRVYVDTETGAFISLYSDESCAAWKKDIGALAMRRYIPLTPVSHEERSRVGGEFIGSILRMVLPKHVEEARAALVDGGWSGLEEFLEAFAPDVVSGWLMHVDMVAGAHVHTLLTEYPHVHIVASTEACGRCDMCKLEAAGDEIDAETLESLATDEVMEHVARQLEARRTPSEEEGSAKQ